MDEYAGGTTRRSKRRRWLNGFTPVKDECFSSQDLNKSSMELELVRVMWKSEMNYEAKPVEKLYGED